MSATPLQSEPTGPLPAVAAEPVQPGERVASIDVLRGFALLGILVMNIQLFAMIESTLFNPSSYGDLTGINFLVWMLSRLLADQKFMTIFSMLFGAGIVLMAERLEARGLRPGGVHYRRMFWLIVFGLLHAHLLWYGDILYVYGMCGLVVYAFRRLSPRWLVPLGLLALAVSSALFLFFGWSMQFLEGEPMNQMLADWAPPPDRVQEELSIYRSGWLDQMAHRSATALEFQTFVFLIWGSWRAGGLMLIGMGLYKLGVFSASCGRGFYLGLVIVGLLVGFPLVSIGMYRDVQAGWEMIYTMFFGWQYNYWGSLAVSLAWVGLVMLACRGGAVPWLSSRLAAVGRMAFTNYMLHTIICTTLFYGHGFGLFGRVQRIGQIGIVVAIWIFQLIVSRWWLARFRYGPFEWLWRSLTYLRLQPFRR